MEEIRTKGHTFGRDSCANFYVGLFNNHTWLNRLATSAAVFGSQHPLPICVGQAFDGDHADACLIVTAVARTEADAPFGLGWISLHRNEGVDITYP